MTTPIRLQYDFDVPARVLYTLDSDPEFDRAVIKAGGMQPESLMEKKVPHGRVEEVRISHSLAVPGFLKKLAHTFTGWVEVRDWNHTEMYYAWRVKTDVPGVRIRIAGKTSIIARGDVHCTRLVEGTFDIGVPLLGPRIARFAIAQTQEANDKRADALRKRLGL